VYGLGDIILESFLMINFFFLVMDIWMLILKSLYFFLPAYFANMAPELLKGVPFLGRPVWEKKLGRNKTWRGMVAAVLIGVLVFLLQKWLFQFNFFYDISIIDYSGFSLLLGFLLGLGVILGDAVGSFYKRRAGIKPGESWKLWDQLDFVIGGLVLSWFVYVPRIEVAVTLLVVSPFLHMLFCRIGYWLKIKKSRF
jgi:CDP-2,3-bis-(O-geranylgeranyl)-sn-glycerol synthase